MSVSGLCSVCGSGQAQFTCDRCGAVVCQEHYDAATGFCAECATEVRRGRGDTGDPSGPR